MILGFRCELTDASQRKAVEEVLVRIRDIHPEDFRWLQRVLVKIAPHPNPLPGDLGECTYANAAATADDFFASSDREVFEIQRNMLLVEAAIEPRFATAVIAHELGHMFGTDHQMDCAYQHLVPDSEWACEALADLYALRWGFEAELRTFQPLRCRLHHSALEVDELLPFVGSLDEWREGDSFFADSA